MKNETIETIMTRKSIRRFTDRKINEEDSRTILKTGMSGPSACNCRPWSFIVVDDRETLDRMAAAKGQYSCPINSCALAVLACGDLELALPNNPEYWIIDGSIAIENMILAAHSLGIGSCWIGIWPGKQKVEAQAKLFGLPDDKIPHSIVVFGYPEEGENFGTPVAKPEWDETRIHYNRW